MEKKETTLKRVRSSKGFTQRGLSEATGISIRTIQHWECGAKDFNKAAALTVYEVSQALGVDMLELLDIPETENDASVAKYQRKYASQIIIEEPTTEEEELALKMEKERARELFERTKKQLKKEN